MRRTRRNQNIWLSFFAFSVVLLAFVVFVVKDVLSAQPSTAVVDVVELSVADAQRRMSAGTLTSRALTLAYLDRIAALDDAGPQLNAVIDLNPTALKDAEARDAERKAGKARGALHGIPILIKDNIDMAGMINSAGSLAFTDSRPKTDAFVVRRRGRRKRCGRLTPAHSRAPRYEHTRSRSANTPAAVTAGPAPGPCTMSGLLLYRAVA